MSLISWQYLCQSSDGHTCPLLHVISHYDTPLACSMWFQTMLLSGSSALDISIPSQLVAWALLSSFHSSVLSWVHGWSPLPTSLSWICPSPSQQHCSPLPFSPLVSCLDLCVLGNETVTPCRWLEINTSKCHICAASAFIYLFIFGFLEIGFLHVAMDVLVLTL